MKATKDISFIEYSSNQINKLYNDCDKQSTEEAKVDESKRKQ